jgi:homogentisate 1,2-dioxygenase
MNSSPREIGPFLENWSREGFTGDSALIRRSQYSPDYLSADGPHVPRRLNVHDVPASAGDPLQMPVAIGAAASGLRLAVSQRSESMTYVLRNVECDELHFVQLGELRIRTALGTLDARPGDFICIPRSVAYQISLLQGPALTLIVESPPALGFIEGSDIIDHKKFVQYARVDLRPRRDTETVLVLKSGDELTRFIMPADPITAIERAGGVNPVWRLNLAESEPAKDGPPEPFLGTSGNELLFYTLSARRARRAPIHVNADYDEIVYYFTGPGAWGAVREPATLTWVPKGVTHNGPDEDVADGYLAWLLESRTTLRLAPAGLSVADFMETGQYGKHQGRQE